MEEKKKRPNPNDFVPIPKEELKAPEPKPVVKPPSPKADPPTAAPPVPVTQEKPKFQFMARAVTSVKIY